MTQKNLIIFISVLFVLCSGYLFFVSDRSLKSDAEKSWWTVYFENPQDNSLNFTIENHSAKNNFHWEVLVDSQKTEEGNAEIQTGETKTIQPNINMGSGKNSVVVSRGTDKKEVYKNIR